MANDYTEDLALAVELIAEFGRKVIVQRLTATASNPDMPWKGREVPTIDKTYPTTGAFVPVAGNDLGKLVTDKELLKRCEQVVLIAGTGSKAIDLKEYTRILDEAVTWKIEWMQEFKPGDTSLLYVMGVKR